MRIYFVLSLVIAISFSIIGCGGPVEGTPYIDEAPIPKAKSSASGTVRGYSESQINAGLARLKNVQQTQDIASYKLQPGDKFDIAVLNHSDWDTKCNVSEDGTIEFGYLDKSIKVEDLSITEVKAMLKKELDVVFTQPLIKIDNVIFSRDVNTVNIMGFFRTPGKIKIEDGDTIMDVVSEAGGLERKYYSRLNSSASDQNRPAVDWNRAHIARYNPQKGYHEVIPYVNLQKLFVEGEYKYNIKVVREDIICVPEATYDSNKVYVLGAVNRPGVYSSPNQLSLVEALTLAGGFNNLRAEEKWVYIVRNSTDKKEIKVYIAELRRILTGEKDENGNSVYNPPLQESDIIFVDTSAIVDFGDWLRNFQPFWGATVLGASETAFNVTHLGN